MAPEFDVDFDYDDRSGGPSPSHIVREIDNAIHPGGENLVVLLEKQRGDGSTKAQRDHILSRSIMQGRLHKDLGLPDGLRLNALEAMMIADTIHSIGTNGESRYEFLDGLRAMGVMHRGNRRFGFNRNDGELGE